MTDSVSALAELLIDARTSGSPIESVPDKLVPSTNADAELVDDRVAELTGWPVLGWKIGCTSAMAQEMLGSPGPFAGRVYRVEESGVEIPSGELMVEPLLEGEFAFRFGVDIDPASPPRDRAALAASVDAVIPAIEFVGGRYSRFAGTPVGLIVADSGSNSLLVLGEARSDVDVEALASERASMSVNEAETGAGTGADVLGDPLDALAWLIDNLAGRGIAIEAGQVVTTGTATQVTSLAAGETATLTMPSIGSASVTRTH